MKTRKYEIVLASGITVTVESPVTSLDKFQKMILDQQMRDVWAEFHLEEEGRILRVDPRQMVGFYAEAAEEPKAAETIG